MSKTFLIDVTRCTACRGCQVACKEWQGFPANKTTQLGWGSHQNPPDLNPNNFKIVRFKEHKIGDRVTWNFLSDQCRHCLAPPCKDMADGYMKNAVVIDEATGAVIYTNLCQQLPKEAFDEMRSACPYDIPRRHAGTGVINKCDMCYERVGAGLIPMCAKACPTSAIAFGDREAMLEEAKKRLAIVKKEYPEAQLIDADDVRVVYLITDKPEFYHKNLLAQGPAGISRMAAIAKLTAPLKRPFRNLLG
jgi:formate dehydrogenase iron-sulfur subunit